MAGWLRGLRVWWQDGRGLPVTPVLHPDTGLFPLGTVTAEREGWHHPVAARSRGTDAASDCQQPAHHHGGQVHCGFGSSTAALIHLAVRRVSWSAMRADAHRAAVAIQDR